MHKYDSITNWEQTYLAGLCDIVKLIYWHFYCKQCSQKRKTLTSKYQKYPLVCVYYKNMLIKAVVKTK